MKLILPFIFFVLLASALADVPVVDSTQIAQSRYLHAASRAQREQQIANQVEQIRQLSTQIEQMRTHLVRYGDPKAVREVSGSSVLVQSLETGVRHEPSSVPVGEIYNPLSARVRVDGEDGDTRDKTLYRPEFAVQDAFARYRETRTQVLESRDQLRRTIAQTTRALGDATTTSEVQKLQGVLVGLQSELIALEQELDTAHQEALLMFFENENERQIQAKARQENDEHRNRSSLRRMQDLFRLPVPTRN